MSSITPATPDDIPELCELLHLLFTQEADFEPDAARQAAGLRAIIGNPAVGRILVAREAGAVVGMANLLFTVSTACGGRVAWLEDLIVRPERRGGGLGAALLEAAVAAARAAGCLRLTLLADRSNAAAIRFYQRHGFSRSEMIPLRLALAPD
jgi:GNAT superfamily N-acetyltransferase